MDGGLVYAALGRQIRMVRRRVGLTQQDLAQRIGLTRTSINNIEHGRQKILLHTLYDLAAALGTKAPALLPYIGPETEYVLKNLPSELQPAEREWVKSVLAVESEDSNG